MDVTFTHDGPITIAEVTADPSSLLAGRSATGIARCRNTDVFVPEIGEAIALGRAIKNLGDAVECEAVGASFTHEDIMRAFEILSLLGVEPVILG